MNISLDECIYCAHAGDMKEAAAEEQFSSFSEQFVCTEKGFQSVNANPSKGTERASILQTNDDVENNLPLNDHNKRFGPSQTVIVHEEGNKNAFNSNQKNAAPKDKFRPWHTESQNNDPKRFHPYAGSNTKNVSVGTAKYMESTAHKPQSTAITSTSNSYRNPEPSNKQTLHSRCKKIDQTSIEGRKATTGKTAQKSMTASPMQNIYPAGNAISQQGYFPASIIELNELQEQVSAQNHGAPQTWNTYANTIQPVSGAYYGNALGSTYATIYPYINTPIKAANTPSLFPNLPIFYQQLENLFMNYAIKHPKKPPVARQSWAQKYKYNNMSTAYAPYYYNAPLTGYTGLMQNYNGMNYTSNSLFMGPSPNYGGSVAPMLNNSGYGGGGADLYNVYGDTSFKTNQPSGVVYPQSMLGNITMPQ